MTESFEIHPSIGIARVGVSDQYFIGPEPGQNAPANYRDGNQDLLKQAARFRVYRCQRNDQGELVSAVEVKKTDATIEWKVQLANRKAAGLEFGGGSMRNSSEPDRSKLSIISRIATVDAGHTVEVLDGGAFRGQTVTLGRAEWEAATGRLIVVGGDGKAQFAPNGPGPASLPSFVDNDDWYDTTSDGPITATVQLNNEATVHVAKPAWLIVGPPDFAPPVHNFVTLYDVAFDVAVNKGWIAIPQTVSFVRHIEPVLMSAVGYASVNSVANIGHGLGNPGDFLSMMVVLADPTAPQQLRKSIFNRLRNPADPPSMSPQKMPRLHSGSDGVLPLPPSKYEMLKRWVDGQFVNDFGQFGPPEAESQTLDRVALQATSGGAFFPGIEAGRIMTTDIYSEPFRLNAAVLVAGQITQGNAVPWQADFYDCRWEAQFKLGWWPAQRPDDVFPDFDQAMAPWAAGVGSRQGMVDKWDKLGLVVPVERPGVPGDVQLLQRFRTL